MEEHQVRVEGGHQVRVEGEHQVRASITFSALMSPWQTPTAWHCDTACSSWKASHLVRVRVRVRVRVSLQQLEGEPPG